MYNCLEGGNLMPTSYLKELFAGPSLHPQLRWHCQPARWSLHPQEHVLTIEPDAGTDFWRKTHYGFEVDNGHFLHTEVAGDFILSTHVRFRPVHQYDQAGLMVRLSPTCWLKTSVEYEPDGSSRLGAVVTQLGFSDWSTQRFSSEAGAGEVRLRIRREGDDYTVEAALDVRDARDWEQIRLAHLQVGQAEGATVACGLYACSPKGAGFVAEFSNLRIDLGRLGGSHE
jgi:regulation of enolase protein 1 (concanavalin A-like superfamily)